MTPIEYKLGLDIFQKEHYVSEIFSCLFFNLSKEEID